ncbi:Solute carrier family 35 member F2 [Trichoplax sp. H2]|nr:Solute carrier family 35 member F2 [Trichoplax sp. H2]|eukprot:RDD41965.1 Solute carrier family 35 member F2 [Trichoplax sp. H2]
MIANVYYCPLLLCLPPLPNNNALLTMTAPSIDNVSTKIVPVAAANPAVWDVIRDDVKKVKIRDKDYKSYKQLNCENLLKKLKARRRKLWKILWLSMLMAFVLAFQQVIGYKLKKIFSIRLLPTTTFLGYGMVAAVYTSRMMRLQSSKISWKLVDRMMVYFAISFLEVAANLIALCRHSIITSRGSIEVFELSIPIILILGFLFLGFRYGIINLLGITVCLLGIRLSPFIVQADYLMQTTEFWRITEVFLCVTGSLLFAICVIFKNFIIKIYGSLELLGMQSSFNCIISGAIVLIFDIHTLLAMKWTFIKGLLILAYGVSFAIFNVLAAAIIELSDSIMLTLCLLPCPLYSNIILTFLEKSKIQFNTLTSVMIIIIGYGTYMLEPVREGERIRNLMASELNRKRIIDAYDENLIRRSTRNKLKI